MKQIRQFEVEMYGYDGLMFISENGTSIQTLNEITLAGWIVDHMQVFRCFKTNRVAVIAICSREEHEN